MSRAAVVVGLALVAVASSGAPAGEGLRVSCSVPGDPAGRVYVLEPAGTTWHLSFTSAETRASTVRLRLPNARPTVTATAARLSYRNANGGRQVELSVGDGPARLEVWVDHGLEVNIEPDLDPRVDLMSTHGPLDGVRCDVTPVTP
jgi:hypothetical protein